MPKFPAIYTLKSTGEHCVFYSADEMVPVDMEDRVTELEVVGYPCTHENWEKFHQKKGEYPFLTSIDSCDCVSVSKTEEIIIEGGGSEIWYCC